MTRMRGAMPGDESVLTLMRKTAMDKDSYGRQFPRINCDKTLFPDRNIDIFARSQKLMDLCPDTLFETVPQKCPSL